MRSPPSPGTAYTRVRPERTLTAPMLEEVARQRGLGDLDAVVGEQVEQLVLRTHVGAAEDGRRSAAGDRSWWRRCSSVRPLGAFEEEGQQGLLGVQPVLRLVPDDRLRSVDDGRLDLEAAVGREAVQEDRVRRRPGP